MKLYKDTQTFRETLTQEARQILGPEESAPPGSVRRVQLTVPQGPQVFMGIDIAVQGAMDEPGIAPNRDYGLPPMSPGQLTQFHLNPHQFLTASCRPGLAFVSLIVEYIQSEHTQPEG